MDFCTPDSYETTYSSQRTEFEPSEEDGTPKTHRRNDANFLRSRRINFDLCEDSDEMVII